MAGQPGPSATRTLPVAQVLFVTAGLAEFQSDYDAAVRNAEAAHAIFLELGDRSGIAETTHRLGSIAFFSGRYADARRLQEEPRRLQRALGGRAAGGPG